MRKPIVAGLITAAVMLAAAVAMKWAVAYGLLDSGEKARMVQVIVGLALAFLGNGMPKMLSPAANTPEAARLQQRVLRVNGWAFTIAGLGYAALAFAPEAVSFPGGLVLIGGALAISMGYMVACVRAREHAG